MTMGPIIDLVREVRNLRAEWADLKRRLRRSMDGAGNIIPSAIGGPAGGIDHGQLVGLTGQDHPAASITLLDIAGDFTATDVEGALAELQSDAEAHAVAADPHAGYVREADADWIDLTDGGATTLHSHAGGGGVDAADVTYTPADNADWGGSDPGDVDEALDYLAANAGGASPDFTYWLPDAPPASAGAADDEFADASGGVPSGWTEVDHGAVQTVTEDEAGLKLFQATHAGDSVSGLYKAIPAGDFTIWIKCGLSGVVPLTAIGMGLALWEDAASSTGDIRTLTLWQDSSQSAARVFAWTAYNAFSSGLATLNMGVDGHPSHLYLRISRTGTTYTFYFSSNGRDWQRIYSTAALGITPAHFGPCMTNTNSGSDASARFDFFRYVASDVGITGLVGGDRIKGFRN